MYITETIGLAKLLYLGVFGQGLLIGVHHEYYFVSFASHGGDEGREVREPPISRVRGRTPSVGHCFYLLPI